MTDDFFAIGLQHETREVVARVGEMDLRLDDIVVKPLQHWQHHRPGGEQQVTVTDTQHAKYPHKAALGCRVGTQLVTVFVDTVDVVTELVLQEIPRVRAADQDQADLVRAADDILGRLRITLLRLEILPLFHVARVSSASLSRFCRCRSIAQPECCWMNALCRA